MTMHQSNDDNTPSGDQSSAPNAEPPSAPPESKTAVSVMPNEQDLDNQIIMNADHVEQPSVTVTGTSTTAQNYIFEGEIDNDFVDGAASNNLIAKQGHLSDGDEIGAVHVDEQAPQLNRRYYMRPSVLARNARARQERARNRRRQETADAGDNRETQTSQSGRETSTSYDGRSTLVRAISTLFASVWNAENQEGLVSATLVEEGEVFEAKPVGFLERKWKTFAVGMCFFLVLLAVLLSVFIAKEATEGPEKVLTIISSMQPSMQPSSPPSFTPGPTLEIVQTRGHVLCGLPSTIRESDEDLPLDLCRAIAAVLFGSPKKFEAVQVNSANRFQQLHGRSVDLLLSRDTHTVEREVRERTTGVGFTFSSPYYYDGVAYYGSETFVRCAEEEKRFDECDLLRICVTDSTTHYGIIESSFPPDFVAVGSSLGEMAAMLLNGTCNVIATNPSILLKWLKNKKNLDGKFVLGNKTIEKEPLAIVTRKDDREFSDILNWVVQSTFYGAEQELTKDSSLCQNYTNLTSRVSDLNFLNAVYCVGNYGELCEEILHHLGMNNMNDGTGMLYAIPFGELDSEDPDGPGDIMNISASLLNRIGNEKGALNCGVIVPHNFTWNFENSISVTYCRTVAAALFNGDFKRVKLLKFTENDESSFVALNNGTIDVLAGAKIQLKYDFASPLLGGFHFSTHYYHGNQTAGYDLSFSFVSLATREDDALFSSFVNCVVLATMYAEENGIKQKRSKEMPLLSIFGDDHIWAVRDAVGYSGSYDQVYKKQFGQVAEEDRGMNILNERGGPQIHSFPGLSDKR